MNEMLSLTPAGMGILRLAIIIPELRLADPTFNSQVMASALASAAGRVCLGQAQCLGQFVGCVLPAFGHRMNFFQKPGITTIKTYKTSFPGVLMVL